MHNVLVLNASAWHCRLCCCHTETDLSSWTTVNATYTADCWCTIEQTKNLEYFTEKNATSEHYFDMMSYIFVQCTPWCHNYAHLTKQPHIWLHCIWQGSSIMPSLLFCVAYLTAHFNFTFVYDCARIIHKQRHIFDPKYVLATIVTSSTKQRCLPSCCKKMLLLCLSPPPSLTK